MQLTKLLKNKKLFLDTSCYIYFLEANKKYLSKVKPIFQLIKQKQVSLYASVINLLELLSSSKLTKKQINLYKLFFSPNADLLKLVPVTSIINEKAAYLRRKYNFKTPDSILIATALEKKVDYFITNDFKLKKIENLKILQLDQ